MNYSVDFLYDKFFNGQLDYIFLDSIKQKFPTNNPYFLVCMAEVVYKFANNEVDETDNLLDSVIEQAGELYRNSDISSYLNEVCYGTC